MSSVWHHFQKNENWIVDVNSLLIKILEKHFNSISLENHLVNTIDLHAVDVHKYSSPVTINAKSPHRKPITIEHFAIESIME